MFNKIGELKVKKGRGERGFTLIELLIVVAIIGILAAIAIPQFAQYRTRAVRASMVADSRNVATSMEAMFTDLQSYVNANGVSIGPGPLTGDIDGVAAGGYNVTVSRGNTLAIVGLAATWSLTITNGAGDGGGFTGPVTMTSGGVCTWASLQNC
jgi:prepilin-type N-terminal cleavage/methylation domain-containing protein